MIGKQDKCLLIHARGVVLETALLVHAANVAQKIRLQFCIGCGFDGLFAMGNGVGHFAHEFLGFGKMDMQICHRLVRGVSKWRGSERARKCAHRFFIGEGALGFQTAGHQMHVGRFPFLGQVKVVAQQLGLLFKIVGEQSLHLLGHLQMQGLALFQQHGAVHRLLNQHVAEAVFNFWKALRFKKYFFLCQRVQQRVQIWNVGNASQQFQAKRGTNDRGHIQKLFQVRG